MMKDKDSEGTLQNAAAKPIAHEPEADMARIYREHSARVLAAAYRVTGSSHDAEDVLQTVFMRLVRREGAALGDEPGAYLHRAAVNAALDVVRSRKTARSAPARRRRGPAGRPGVGAGRPRAGLGRASRRGAQGAGRTEPPFRRDLRPPLFRGLRQPRDRAHAGRLPFHRGRDAAPRATPRAREAINPNAGEAR